jgi:pyruvate dehydrogenase E2 component (dihydrolipoamide acetyltransferase)
MANIEIQVPDIGDFDEVTVIELLVKVGDTIKAEQSLITVESDKASMEIPSSHAGVVKEIKVKEVKVKEVKRNVNVDVVLKEPVLKRLELLSKKWASLWVKQHLLPVNL